MSLWLALFLPALPVQLAERALERTGPLVVVEGPAQRPIVAFCNQAASTCGIVAGQKLAAAQALTQSLFTIARNREHEHDCLLELAGWAYQFSAQISLRDGMTGATSGLVLETGGSTQLFGGQARLHRRIERSLAALGFRAAFGYAATPQAAWWIAAARAHGLGCPDAIEPAGLETALAPLPLRLTEWDASVLESLHALGLSTIGDVRALPRDQFSRRFGTALLADLDRALGRLPHPQTLYAPPRTFLARLDLPADVIETEQLMFPAHRLLRSLEGFLRGQDAGTTELHFIITHNSRRAQPVPPSRVTLALASPEREARRLAQLFAERLARVALPEPAVTLALAVDHLHPFAPRQHASLLPPAPGTSDLSADTGWQQLAETLHARLGSERVFQLQAVDDHRPEHAFRTLPLVASQGERRTVAPIVPQRPLLILSRPASLEGDDEAPAYDGALRLIAGPERIESGWWDLGNPARRSVFRDYFVARNPRGQTLWIFRELAAPQRWFLHGFFA
ncbi:MAG TPA: DNA polymerase Y family protein [Burkholderiaceae bacterium]|nr:DNA polymerase Y family protein [Burkholderiaceae bacterium]